MHFIMLGISLMLAVVLRAGWSWQAKSWEQRWKRALQFFVLPPLLLIVTAIAIVWMGPHGVMLTAGDSWLSYGAAVVLLIRLGLGTAQNAFQGWQTLQQIQDYPQETFSFGMAKEIPTRRLKSPIPYAAQVGFWRSQIVVSQGLQELLTPDQLQAVLTHEQGHAYYKDTFWFFWLGCLRNVMGWLPHTESLWQELLTLRELRADRWAAQQVDGLLLAESLLQVVRYPTLHQSLAAPLSGVGTGDRLTERIEALLTDSELPPPLHLWDWGWLAIALLPLLTIPFHHYTHGICHF